MVGFSTCRIPRGNGGTSSGKLSTNWCLTGVVQAVNWYVVNVVTLKITMKKCHASVATSYTTKNGMSGLSNPPPSWAHNRWPSGQSAPQEDLEVGVMWVYKARPRNVMVVAGGVCWLKNHQL